MAAVSGAERRLAAPLEVALKHCGDLVRALPDMVDINRRAFALDPLVHAFFASPADIEEMLGRSQALRDFLGDPRYYGHSHFHALFAARRREKQAVGYALQGEVLRQDVPQTLLYFSSHSLTAIAADLQTTRDMLAEAALDSLLKSFLSRVDAIRLERQELQTERDMQRVRLKAASNDPSRAAECERQLLILEQRIQTLTTSLQPERLIDALASHLSEPEQALRLEPTRVQVDRSGVVLDAPTDGSATAGSLYFPELVGRDRRRHVVMLARIPRDEADAAVAKILDQQRRFILI